MNEYPSIPEELLSDKKFLSAVRWRRHGLKTLCRRYGIEFNASDIRRLSQKLQANHRAERKGRKVGGGGELVKETIKGDTRETTFQATEYTTAEDLAKAHGIDTRIWEAVKTETGRWDMGYKDADGEAQSKKLSTVKVTWRRIVFNERILDVTEECIKRLKKHSPKIAKPNYKAPSGDRHLLQLCVFDSHIGKLSWAPESGHDYDLDIGVNAWETAIWDLMQKSQGYDLEKIVLILGQDFFNVDSMVNETTAGTRQDEDSRWQKSFMVARDMTTKAIQQLGEVAPVHVMVVPGNHDTQRSFYLGQVLDATFTHAEHISVDCSPQYRKAFQYGYNGVMVTHGDKERPDDLGKIFAMEFPDIWSATECREVHHGHGHRKMTTKTVSDSSTVTVRMIPALCPPEQWHSSKGFKNIPNSKAFVWHREDLLQAILQHYPRQFRSQRMPVHKEALIL